ncbi:hypothetical protein [Burkholderia glumae]|uniref:hypothetical protein n=1 Tax=Burkholderia glumae TaxID=337 RepID=UPI000F5DE28B|nr:hypothetical protein [Burkholderia glumae]QJW78788.1 hypothetical protein GAS18_08465 [Burkholderia glumae]
MANRLKDDKQLVRLRELLKQIEQAETTGIDDATRYLLAVPNDEPTSVDRLQYGNDPGTTPPLDADTRLHLLTQLNLVARHATLFDGDGMPDDDARPTFGQFVFYTAEIYPLLASHDIAVSLPGDEGSDERFFPNGKRIAGWMPAYRNQPWISSDRTNKALMANISDAKLI